MELLEREMCLHALDAALLDVRRGTGRIALVSGEAGIGKTVLLDRFTRDCAHPVRVLWGTCDASFTPRPLGLTHTHQNKQAKPSTVRCCLPTS